MDIMPATSPYPVLSAEAERPSRVARRPEVVIQGVLHHAPVEAPQPADSMSPDALRVAASQWVSRDGCVSSSSSARTCAFRADVSVDLHRSSSSPNSRWLGNAAWHRLLWE